MNRRRYVANRTDPLPFLFLCETCHPDIDGAFGRYDQAEYRTGLLTVRVILPAPGVRQTDGVQRCERHTGRYEETAVSTNDEGYPTRAEDAFNSA